MISKRHFKTRVTVFLLSVSGSIAAQNLIKDSGNVGIGTEDPQSKLVIKQGDDAITISGASIGFNRNVSGGQIFNSAKSAWQFNSEADKFRLIGFGGASAISALTVLENGDFGIGTPNPASKLHVTGDIINGGTDFRLGINDGRDQGIKKSNRALVHLQNDELHLNFNGDFEGGTVVDSKLRVEGNIYGKDIVSSGSNSWIFHTPDTGSEILYIAPVNDDGTGNWSNQTTFMSNGNVGIGTGEANPKNKLSVNGTIWAKEVKVSLSDAADWVFEADYKLKPLKEVERFIKRNKHLPEIPSAEEFRANDMKVSEMTNKLLQKIEELTLYTIEQEKQNLALEARLAKLELLLN